MDFEVGAAFDDFVILCNLCYRFWSIYKMDEDDFSCAHDDF